VLVVVVVVVIVVVVIGGGGGGGGGRGVAAAAGTVLQHQHVYLLSLKIMPKGGFFTKHFVTCQNLGITERN
jgi:hypothetical protein